MSHAYPLVSANYHGSDSPRGSVNKCVNRHQAAFSSVTWLTGTPLTWLELGALVDILHQVRSLQTAKLPGIEGRGERERLSDQICGIFQMTARALATFLNLRAASVRSRRAEKGELHWIGSPQMLPLLFGIVVKRHHPIPVLVDQISRSLQSSLATPMLESSFDLLGFLPCFCIRDLPQHRTQWGRTTCSDPSRQELMGLSGAAFVDRPEAGTPIRMSAPAVDYSAASDRGLSTNGVCP